MMPGPRRCTSVESSFTFDTKTIVVVCIQVIVLLECHSECGVYSDTRIRWTGTWCYLCGGSTGLPSAVMVPTSDHVIL
jgi:hypothetical protein